MPRLLSCGVIVRREPGELLLCHATGRNYWDIPKGVRDEGETTVAAALRELREEAGIELDESQLRDAGVHKYLPRKDLHLFVLDPPERIAQYRRVPLFNALHAALRHARDSGSRRVSMDGARRSATNCAAKTWRAC